MKQSNTLRSLTTLVQLRSTEVEQLQSALSQKASVRDRLQRSVARLDGLYTNSAASGALPLAQSLNCGDYKQAVMQLAARHRGDLALHEADLAHTQSALNAAWARREVLGQVLDTRRREVANALEQKERKRQDELASQLWHRGQV